MGSLIKGRGRVCCLDSNPKGFSVVFLLLCSPDLPVAAGPEKISSALNPFRRPAQPLQVLPRSTRVSYRVSSSRLQNE